jgi:heme exporter protein A
VDVTFAVPAGALVMLAGRNGSGKSTLLRVLATAIRADRGGARVGGWDILTHSHEVRSRTAILGHASHLYEPLTALENLALAARFTARPASPRDLLPLLDEVGLSDRAHDWVSTFSAGMRKRLSLARVLLQEPSVVLLDEPYGELDPPGFLLIDRLLGRFRERGVTVLMATHLLERGASLCDLGLVLDAGRVGWWGRAADLPSQGGLDPAGPPEPGAGAAQGAAWE